MRLVVNMSSVAAHPTGLGSYATRMCHQLARSFSCTALAPAHLALPPGMARVPTPSSVAIGGKGSRLVQLASLARRQAFYMRGPILRGDFVYNPTHHGFFNTRRQIITIHDLISLHFPENFGRQARFFRTVLPRILARSQAVFVVSEFTRTEVLREFDVAPERVFVVPNALDVEPVAQPAEKQPYLLVVGAHLPHKNIEEVLRMAHLWSDRYTLRIVGAAGLYGARLRALVAEGRIGHRVEFLPFVSDAELDRLYAHASALLYPSLMEGFGLPPLEALARHTTAIASDIPVHREVLGDAAVLVRLGQEGDWADAFARLDAPEPPQRAAARTAVLHRYSPAEVGKQLETALLAVEPGLQAFRR